DAAARDDPLAGAQPRAAVSLVAAAHPGAGRRGAALQPGAGYAGQVPLGVHVPPVRGRAPHAAAAGPRRQVPPLPAVPGGRDGETAGALGERRVVIVNDEKGAGRPRQGGGAAAGPECRERMWRRCREHIRRGGGRSRSRWACCWCWVRWARRRRPTRKATRRERWW